MLARSLSAASAQTVARVKTQAPSRHGARALRLLGLFCSEMRAPEKCGRVSGARWRHGGAGWVAERTEPIAVVLEQVLREREPLDLGPHVHRPGGHRRPVKSVRFYNQFAIPNRSR
jgi:hypothetical protein